jgi:hypothetical protein
MWNADYDRAKTRNDTMHPTVLVVVKVKSGKCTLDVLLGELPRYLGLFDSHAL